METFSWPAELLLPNIAASLPRLRRVVCRLLSNKMYVTQKAPRADFIGAVERMVQSGLRAVIEFEFEFVETHDPTMPYIEKLEVMDIS